MREYAFQSSSIRWRGKKKEEEKIRKKRTRRVIGGGGVFLDRFEKIGLDRIWTVCDILGTRSSRYRGI